MGTKKGASRGALGVVLAVRPRSGSRRLPGALGKTSERLGIANGDVRQDLAVELDLGQPQSVHQLAVGHALAARGGVDADDPKAPEVALLVAAIAVGVAVGLEQGLLRAPVAGMGLTTEALGALERGPALLARVN